MQQNRNSRLRIAIVPNHESGLNNRIFSQDYVINQNWMEANVSLLQESQTRGFSLATIDRFQPNEADLVIVTDLPENLDRITELRSAQQNAKLILLAYESPAVQPHAFEAINHQHFDGVITYNRNLDKKGFYYPFHLPVGFPPPNVPNVEFAHRKLCVMLNSNFRTCITDLPRPWHKSQQYRKIQSGGWKLPKSIKTWHQHGLSYDRRARIARCGERIADGKLDVFGKGWSPLTTGWYRRFFPEKPYACWRGEFNYDKLKLIPQYRFTIAFENFRGNVGYISEKIFDALYAGSIPIYLGDDDIESFVPSDCFVPAKQFRRDIDLFSYLNEMNESEWNSMRDAGQAFLSSKAAALFQPKNYADTILGIIEEIVNL